MKNSSWSKINALGSKFYFGLRNTENEILMIFNPLTLLMLLMINQCWSYVHFRANKSYWKLFTWLYSFESLRRLSFSFFKKSHFYSPIMFFSHLFLAVGLISWVPFVSLGQILLCSLRDGQINQKEFGLLIFFSSSYDFRVWVLREKTQRRKGSALETDLWKS